MNPQNEYELKALLHQFLSLGEALLANGAEISRVEDTLTRLGLAYGAERMNVFVITSSMIITMIFPDGQELTQTRRILSAGSSNFTKLEALNALSRDCCRAPKPPKELAKALAALDAAPPSRLRFYLGSVLAAGSFSIFFGGNIIDGLTAALFAFPLCFLQEKLPALCSSRVIYNFLISLLVGLALCGCAALFPVLHIDKLIIGDIMLLIPGIAMTNAVRDILIGDTIAGIMRLVETLLWAGALACGFMIAIMLI
ncbi:MAG: threonine/serine exporter family protein [Lachnospiraceae bacterium]|jgi:uncharacterized membrane protein YjjP (DUF1212 family)|nr:threonine/serine exporter family protein [Lachnospiraceae bacterium]